MPEVVEIRRHARATEAPRPARKEQRPKPKRFARNGSGFLDYRELREALTPARLGDDIASRGRAFQLRGASCKGLQMVKEK